jgi:putative two-component system response regulator
MHDIGKIGIPDGILLKGGRLTPEEFEVVKLHCEIGARMLRGSDIPLLNMAEQIALAHHEKWDGSGYPHGLAGDEIPLPAHMVAIADVFDSLTCARAYRLPFSEEEALDILSEGRGRHFSPDIFDIFMDVLPAFRHIKREISDDRAGSVENWVRRDVVPQRM